MKKLILAMLCIGMVLGGLAACADMPAEVEETTQADTVIEDNFLLTIVTDNSVYQADDEIVCYATVEYRGDEDITIYHSDPLVAFGIEGGVFDDGHFRNDVLISTTFSPGDDIRYEYQKNGGWSADDPNADFFEAFYADDTLVLPPGEYTLSVSMAYSTDDNDVRGTQHGLTASVMVKVAE